MIEESVEEGSQCELSGWLGTRSDVFEVHLLVGFVVGDIVRLGTIGILSKEDMMLARRGGARSSSRFA